MSAFGETEYYEWVEYSGQGYNLSTHYQNLVVTFRRDETIEVCYSMLITNICGTMMKTFINAIKEFNVWI